MRFQNFSFDFRPRDPAPVPKKLPILPTATKNIDGTFDAQMALEPSF
jgi:hypothetical protein